MGGAACNATGGFSFAWSAVGRNASGAAAPLPLTALALASAGLAVGNPSSSSNSNASAAFTTGQATNTLALPPRALPAGLSVTATLTV